MDFKFDRAGRSTGVVVLSGRVDVACAADLKDRIRALVASGCSQLVVDLGSVPFIDSSGLGALICGLKAARVAGGDCRIARAPDQVRYVLRVSTLDRVLAAYPTVEEALAEFEPTMASPSM